MNYIILLFDFLFGKVQNSPSLSNLIDLYKPKLHIKSNTWYAISYTEPLIRKVIKDMKYEGNKKSIELCSQILNKLIDDLVDGNMVLVPIPMHWIKILIRRQNHIKRIVKSMNREFIDIIYWKKFIPSRAKSGSRRKRENTVQNNMDIKLLREMSNTTIVLIDDVVTTGDTINEAKRVLSVLNPKKIISLAIAG